MQLNRIAIFVTCTYYKCQTLWRCADPSGTVGTIVEKVGIGLILATCILALFVELRVIRQRHYGMEAFRRDVAEGRHLKRKGPVTGQLEVIVRRCGTDVLVTVIQLQCKDLKHLKRCRTNTVYISVCINNTDVKHNTTAVRYHNCFCDRTVFW